MPDLINPVLSSGNTPNLPDIQPQTDSSWVRPTVNIPDNLKENQISLEDFNAAANNILPKESAAEIEQKKFDASLSNGLVSSKMGTSFKYFDATDALRYKQNDRLWKKIGYNPEVPADITDAMYEHHESTWESFKNILPKIWDSSTFAYKNYFQSYVDTAKAISALDMNKLHNDSRFQEHIQDELDLENLHPDYKSDAPGHWSDAINPFSKGFGDASESSAGGLGFMIGTIGAAATENAAIASVTAGFGELLELPNSARKVYTAINDYYSLKRAYGLVKSFVGAKTVMGGLSAGADIWRLTNSALSISAYDGASNASQYIQNFKDKYISEHGRAPDERTMSIAKKAADQIANKTILFETPMLLLNNAVQFGNLIAPKTTAALFEKFASKQAFEFGGGTIKEGFQTTVQASERGLMGKVFATKPGQILKHALIGGATGEVQTGVRTGVEDYYNDKYFNKDNRSISKSLGVGFSSLNSNDGLKAFTAGFAMAGLFQAIAMPFHMAFKPTLRTPEEHAAFMKENPTKDPDSMDAKYRAKNGIGKVLNKVFNVGMEGVRKEEQKANLERVAQNLNQNGLEQFLKSDGFFDLVKNKQTALALAKFMESNDMFNMANAQNLQLNRMLFSGLANGKIDLQINKLKEFATQPFEALKTYFGLKEADYATKEEQDAFMNSFRGFAEELGNKKAEIQKIYDSEKGEHADIIKAAAKTHENHINKINDFTTKLKEKYKVETEEELDGKVTPEEKKAMVANNIIATRSKLRFYGIQEAIKASVFSQVGMKQDAKAANGIIKKLRELDTTGIHYQELGDMFSETYRDTRIQQLEEKVALAKENNDPNEDLYTRQRNNFKELKDQLDKQFGKIERMDGSRDDTFDHTTATKSLQDYLYSVREEINNLDNNTSLSDRINSQSEKHLELLGEWMKIQNHHQENLNLYNYLSNVSNREHYIDFQSGKLADFFSEAADIHTEENRNQAAQEENKSSADNTAEPVTKQITDENGNITEQVPGDPIAKTDIEVKEHVKDFITAVRDKDYGKIDSLKKIFKDLPENQLDKILQTVLSNKMNTDILSDVHDILRDIMDKSRIDKVSKPKEPVKPLTKEAQDLVLSSKDAIPIAVTPIIERIAKENGIEVTNSTKPEEIIAALSSRMPDPLEPIRTTSIDPKIIDNNPQTLEEALDYKADTQDELRAVAEQYGVEVPRGMLNQDQLLDVMNAIDAAIEKKFAEPSVSTEPVAEVPPVGTLAATEPVEANTGITATEDDIKTLRDKLEIVNKKLNNDAVDIISDLYAQQRAATTEEAKKAIQDQIDRAEKPLTKNEIKELNLEKDSLESQIKNGEALLGKPAGEVSKEDNTEKEATKQKEEKELVAKRAEVDRQMTEPQPLAEVPPLAPNGEQMGTDYAPIGVNQIDRVIDDARRDGRFVFDTVKLEENEGIKDNVMILKSASDPMALKHRRIMDKLSEIQRTEGQDFDNYLIKLETVSKDNRNFFYQRDLRNNSVIGMLVDSNGKYHYFDEQGNVTTPEKGQPFGVEYEDNYYDAAKLGMSRAEIMTGKGVSIEHGFGETKSPLMTIVALLANNVPVYGRIKGITNGKLSRADDDRTFNSKKKDSYKMRTLKELIDNGEIDDQYVDVRIEGFYIDYPNSNTDQRIKIGRPTVFDVKSGLTIPLTGKKLKDATFAGTPINEGSQLYEILDILDRTGKLSVNDLREDKTRIVSDSTDLLNTYQFLREMLYSKNFIISMSPDNQTIELKRTSSPKALSIWDAEINFVIKKGPYLDIPFTTSTDADGNPMQTDMTYEDFLQENFTTGAVQAQISPTEKAFTKIDKRAIIELENNHNELLKKIGTSVQTMKVSTDSPKEGDHFAVANNLTDVFTVVSSEGGMVKLMNDNEQEKEISEEMLLKKWLKVDKIDKPKVVITKEQASTIAKIQTPPYVKSQISVTSLPRPSKKSGGTGTLSSATVAGDVIDFIAKNIFDGTIIRPENEIKIKDGISKLVDYFKTPQHYQTVVDKITQFKEDMEREGYIFKTGVRVQDSDTGVGGEIDLVAVAPSGEQVVIDFKTSLMDFNDSHLSQDYETGTTERQYFATQGYVYRLILAKQTGAPVSENTRILALPISYNTGLTPYNVKIVEIRPIKNHNLIFSKNDIATHYKGLNTVKEIVDKYNTLKAQNIVSPRDKSEGITGHKKSGLNGLLSSIHDIRLAAASNEVLLAEINHMSSMFGESMLVDFINTMNKFKYGEWTTNGTILWNNAIAGTGYHEGWHQFSQLYLTPSQKIKLYDSIRKERFDYIGRDGKKHNTGDNDDRAIEEFLGDEWVKFVKSENKRTDNGTKESKEKGEYVYPGKEGKKTILDFFKNLWRMLKRFFSGEKPSTQLFKDLYNGNLGKYTKDVNNAIWGNLNSSILDNTGNEVINHVRTSLYTEANDHFISEILAENKYSFTWLRENTGSENLKRLLRDKFIDLQANIIEKLSIGSTEYIDEIFTNADQIIQNTVNEKGISPELASSYINQIQELQDLLGEENGAFDNFQRYAIANSNLDTFRDSEQLDMANNFDTENVRSVITNIEEGEELEELDEEGRGSAGKGYGEEANDKSAWIKASKEIQDFFRTTGRAEGINEDGTPKLALNELGLPMMHDYASVFNKTKGILAGKYTEDAIMAALSKPHTQKNFPESKIIFDKLQNYIQLPTPENFSFIRQFINIMSLPEIDNRELSVDFDAANDKSPGKTAVKMRTLSRSGEMADMNKWAFNFRSPNETKVLAKINENTSPNDIFNNHTPQNMLYNIEGVVKMNPFVNYTHAREIPTKEFLNSMGIVLNKGFWESSATVKFADRLKEFIIKNLELYKEYSNYRLAHDLNLKEKDLEIFKANNTPNKLQANTIINTYFINNPLTIFRERGVLHMGDVKLETWSLHTLMQDISRENSIYSLESSARSFTNGEGKLKYPFYNTPMIAYRMQQLNNIDNIKDFDKDDEMTPFNPNINPWLTKSIFYTEVFDSETGDRYTTSRKVRNSSGETYSAEKVRIQMADLSSYRTYDSSSERNPYKTVHPKALNGQGKMFFDAVTLFEDGYIEIPRAGDSSTMFAIKLNSYDAKRIGDDFRAQKLPVDISSSSIFQSNRFRDILNNQLMADLMKLKWYFNRNPSPEEIEYTEKGEIKKRKTDDPARNYHAHNLNVFKKVLSKELSDKLIDAVKTMKGNSDEAIRLLVKENAEAINTEVGKFFIGYAAELYNGKGSSFMKMSPKEKLVIKNMLNLYQDRSKSSQKEDIQREKEITSYLEETGGKSNYQTGKETAYVGKDSSLMIAASLFAANQWILNVEFHNWFMGDISIFTNPFKRGKVVTGTGSMAKITSWSNNILNTMSPVTMKSLLTGKSEPRDYRFLRTSVQADAIIESKYFDTMMNNISEWEQLYGTKLTPEQITARRAELEKSFNGYKSINAGDGQSVMNLDSYRILRIIYGTWKKEDENEYKRQLAILRIHKNLYKDDKRDYINEEGIIVTGKEQDELFIKSGPRSDGSFSELNPLKLSYAGPEAVRDDNGNLTSSPIITKLDKSSFAPLLPEALLGTGSPHEEMMIDMAKNDIDYTKFESVSKAAKHNDIISFYDQNGGKLPGVTLSEHKYEELYSSYMKDVMSTEGMHEENILGSQIRVILFDVKYQKEVQNNPAVLKELEEIEQRYLKSVNTIMDFKKLQFFNKYGMTMIKRGTVEELEITNPVRHATAMLSLAKKNNFPSNMLEYLKYNPDTETYQYDPSLMFNRTALINMIGGEMDTEMRRLKVRGTSAIQLSSMGNTFHTFDKPTAKQLKKYGTTGLHYYQFEKDENGKITKTSTMGIKITMQGQFENLYALSWRGKRISQYPKPLNTLNEAMNDPKWKEEHMDKLTLIGKRIPTANINFIDHAEIMEFLPKSSGNVIIGPPEHVIKSGSDFDVDKLNLIFPSIDENGNLVSLPKLSVAEIHTKINEKTNSVSDHIKNQKQIKNFLKKEKRDYKEISKYRDKLFNKINDDFFNIDNDVYSGMVAGGSTFQELVNYFHPFLIDYEGTLSDLNGYNTLTEALGKADEANNGSKMDMEFADLIKQLGRYKDYHTNEMLKTMKEVVSHPAYLRGLVTPSNADYLLEQAERIGELTGRKTTDGLSSTENTKYTTINGKGEEYLYYAKDLGGYAIMRIWYSLLNYSKLSLNRDWKYGAKQAPVRIYHPLADVNQRQQLGDSTSINLFGQSLDGRSIADTADQFQTLTIDLPSNTSYVLFNINKYNNKLSKYLMMSRYTIPMIMSFLNQPILLEVYATYEERIKKYPDYLVKTAMLEVAKKYGITGGVPSVRNGVQKADFQSMYDNMFKLNDGEDGDGSIIGVNQFVQNPGISASHLLSEDVYFTQEDMDNDIKSPTKDKAFRDRQKNILLYFMAATMEAQNFSKMQFSFSEDRNKNTNFYTLSENEDNKRDIRGDKNDDISLDGTMFNKDAIDKLENHSIYTPFTYNKAAQLFYKKFAKQFTDPEIARGIKKILSKTNTFGIDRQLLATRIEGDFIEMIYKNFADFNITTYDPYTNTLASSSDTFSTHFIKRLYNINKDENFKSSEDRLTKFLQNYPELNKIAFISKLYPEGILGKDRKDDTYTNVMDGYDANVIRFKRSQENTIQERNRSITELENLISFNPHFFRLINKYSKKDIQNISAFMTELSYQQLYQAGPTNTADNFGDLLPHTMWQEFVSTAFANYNKAVKAEKIDKSDMMKMFNMLYTENNPRVPWSNSRTIYNLTYYDEPQSRMTEADRINARKNTTDTRYFRNFRAGKFYDLKMFAEDIGYKAIENLNC